MTESGLSPLLRDLLRCPCPSHATLTFVSLAVEGSSKEGELVCDECGTAFPIRDGIPVMLMDEGRRPGSQDQSS